jgi:hypothetical protein
MLTTIDQTKDLEMSVVRYRLRGNKAPDPSLEMQFRSARFRLQEDRSGQVSCSNVSFLT